MQKKAIIAFKSRKQVDIWPKIWLWQMAKSAPESKSNKNKLEAKSQHTLEI